jgi:Domain of unknown function (DUF3372)
MRTALDIVRPENADKVGRKLDPEAASIVVLFNVDKITKTISLPDYAGIPLELHPILRHSVSDFVVRQSHYDASTGTFTMPPRTTAVFLERQRSLPMGNTTTRRAV